MVIEGFSQEGCRRKSALMKDVKAAVSELAEIHSREVGALINENFTRAADMETLLQAVRIRKSQAVELYRKHVQEHGC